MILFNNPVVIKELRERMRGNRAFLLLTLYLLALSLILGITYLVYRAASVTPGSVEERQVFGKILFGLTAWLELLTVSFVAPALTAGAISSERERQTYDLLRTTLLPARSLVLGKFFSGLSFLLLLLFAAIPLQSLAFLFGGVAPSEVMIGTLMLLVTAFTFSAVGIFISSFLSRTLASTILSYAFTTLTIFGFPVILWAGLTIFGILSSGSINTTPTLAQQILLIGAGWTIVSLNPLAAAVATEAILLEEQSILFLTVPLASSLNIYLISPWIPFTLLYLAFGVLLLYLSVRLVRRAER